MNCLLDGLKDAPEASVANVAEAWSSKPKKTSKPTTWSKTTQWLAEKERPWVGRYKDGKPHGTGSWYKRVPGDYSTHEYLAWQGYKDRVCTVDCMQQARIQRVNEHNDSDKESDWKDRTSIDPATWYKRPDPKRSLRKNQADQYRLQELRKKKHNLLPPDMK